DGPLLRECAVWRADDRRGVHVVRTSSGQGVDCRWPLTLRGLRFLIFLAPTPLPTPLLLPDMDGKRMREWDRGTPNYRMRRLRWKVGKNVSHYLDYSWPAA